MNLKEICQTLSREIQKLVPYDRAAINILQRDEKFFSVYAEESRLPAPAIPEGVSVREGTATSWVFDHKEPLICRDVLKDPRFPLTHKRYKNVGLRSYVILPLMAEGKVLGALNLGSLTPGRYGKKEIEILSPVAEILSMAIENSNLYQESQRLLREQTALREIFSQINLLDLSHLLDQLVEQALTLLRVDYVQVRLLDASGTLHTMALAGIGSEYFRTQVARSGTRRSSWVMENRRPLAIKDVTQDKVYGPGRLMRERGVKGYLCVPLIASNQKSIGVLQATSLEEREFTQEEIAVAQQLAAGAAIAIENARLFEEVKQKSLQLEALIKVNRDIVALLDRETLLPRIAEEARRILKVDSSIFRLIEGEYLILLAASDPQSLSFRPKLRLGESLSGKIVKEDRVLAIKNVLEDPTMIEEHREITRKAGYRSFLGVPLRLRGRTIGTLNFYSKEEREFSSEEIDLVTAFGDQAAIAVENANLFQEVQKKSQELEEAYKTKSAFLNTMAHELRTPLNVLIATMQLFTDGFYGELSQDQMKGFETMERNARNLLDLISDILELARLEAKRVPLQIEEFLFKEIIDELESYFMPLVREKGLELRFRLDDPMIKLKTDKSKIKAIIQNLLGNAVKYTDSGEIEVRVSALLDGQASGSQGKSLSILVRDTGIGIKESDLPHIFQAFYLAEGVNRRKYPGSGLGLSIVERLLEMLGGNIQAQSEWGKGSTFTVTLPLIHPSGL